MESYAADSQDILPVCTELADSLTCSQTFAIATFITQFQSIISDDNLPEISFNIILFFAHIF
jgi:hypothetical protein